MFGACNRNWNTLFERSRFSGIAICRVEQEGSVAPKKNKDLFQTVIFFVLDCLLHSNNLYINCIMVIFLSLNKYTLLKIMNITRHVNFISAM